jgi:L-alanine-DL-glutamate epimerase-like enolase superfamily enzyme
MIQANVKVWGGAVSGVENAHDVWMRRDGLLLELDGGLGEATPLPGFGRDDLALARSLLERVRVSGAPEDLASIAHAVESAGVQASPSARFALETALLDGLARARGTSVASLFGSTPASLPRAVLIGRIDSRDVFERAEAAVLRGARALKLKASGKILAAECARLAQLRRHDVALRVDLNGGLDVSSARRALEAYAGAGVELVEEPTSGAGLLELGEEALPWFADESLADPRLADGLLDHPGCAGFVLKPTLLGGFFRCLELSRRARRAEKRVMVSHAFEGPVALAAAAELALAARADSAGLDRHAALSAFPSARLPQLPDDRLEVVDAPRVGLGIEWTHCG